MPLALRADFNAPGLGLAARRSKNAAQAHRLLALAAVYDGATRTKTARIGFVTLQIVRDWVVKFNGTDSGPTCSKPCEGAERLTASDDGIGDDNQSGAVAFSVDAV